MNTQTKTNEQVEQITKLLGNMSLNELLKELPKILTDEQVRYLESLGSTEPKEKPLTVANNIISNTNDILDIPTDELNITQFASELLKDQSVHISYAGTNAGVDTNGIVRFGPGFQVTEFQYTGKERKSHINRKIPDYRQKGNITDPKILFRMDDHAIKSSKYRIEKEEYNGVQNIIFTYFDGRGDNRGGSYSSYLLSIPVDLYSKKKLEEFSDSQLLELMISVFPKGMFHDDLNLLEDNNIQYKY